MTARGRRTSCGTLVTRDGSQLLLGRFTGLGLWDIPKGLADPGEDHRTAAVRELQEETGLVAPPDALRPLGLYRYRPAKDLALFAWQVEEMPDPSQLTCVSQFRARDGRWLPEFDGFAVLDWESALARVGRNLAHVLSDVRTAPEWRALR